MAKIVLFGCCGNKVPRDLKSTNDKLPKLQVKRIFMYLISP